MIRALAATLATTALLGSLPATAQTRVTDATGRAVAVPATVERVYAAGPPASVILLALAPPKLIGWTRAPRPDEAAYLPDAVATLPSLGRLTGRGNTANVEVVMQARPDLIVDVGSTSPTFVTLAERAWRDVPAVRAGRVYVPPHLPFGWFDSPPSLNRLLGVQWLVRILHPKLFPEPLGPRVKAFHALYYHRTPTDAQVRALLDTGGVSP